MASMVEHGRGRDGELLVFSLVRDSQCSKCRNELESGSFLVMHQGQPLCVECAGLAELVFVPSGDAALTRRSKKRGVRSAVVVRWSRARKRYERQGILVEAAALKKAEQECAADAARREARKPARTARAQAEDRQLVKRMQQRLSALFPGCPRGQARAIPEHTALRGSGRVGRSAAGRSLDEEALRLAVIAAIRHRHTRYDELIPEGLDRNMARSAVAGEVDGIPRRWEAG